MRLVKLFGPLALASSLALATPAVAQDETRPMVALDVSFFDEVQLGDVTLSPVNIFHDTRCEDPEFCFRNNQFAISVILFTDEGLEEVILRLFESKPITGGTLTLTNTGTPPSQNGAIGLEEYRLELVFQPTPKEPITKDAAEAEVPVTDEASRQPGPQPSLPAQIEPARA